MEHRRGLSPLLLPLLVLLPLSASLPAHAQRHIVIYRCIDAKGALTIQNDVPCPKGSRQKRQTVDVPPAMPSYEPRAERMPHVVAAEQEQEQEQIDQALPPPVPADERKPPPALYQCTSWNQTTSLTEDATPPQHCAPLNVVGLDGNPVAGAVHACQNVADQCAAIPEDRLCKAWQRRVDEARFRWKFAKADDDHARELEYEKLAAILRNSTCGQ